MTTNEKETLKNKIDFAVIFSVRKANPNGDPRDNRPRTNNEGYGEVSDVCLKRKIRNRLQDTKESIFVQSDNKRVDEYRSLKERYEGNAEIKKLYDSFKKKKKKKPSAPSLPLEGTESTNSEMEYDMTSVNSLDEVVANVACKAWFDVRAFGQVFAYEGEKEEGGDKKAKAKGVSIGVRGPVTIQSAYSKEKVMPWELPITKSVSGMPPKEDKKKSSDTMGMKHRVDKAVYVTFGGISPQLASKTGFSDEDAEKIKEALKTLFVNDESSARPAGSMEVLKVIWWKHNSPIGQYSSAKVHRSLNVNSDGTYELQKLKNLTPEELDGQ
jgi:CRISPR-associated protein Csd2